jgi:hypothetical protein
MENLIEEDPLFKTRIGKENIEEPFKLGLAKQWKQGSKGAGCV